MVWRGFAHARRVSHLTFMTHNSIPTQNEVDAFLREFHLQSQPSVVPTVRESKIGPRVQLRTSYAQVEHSVKVEFDGGTPCNIPRLGYGNGYGSYQISENGVSLAIQRCSFGVPMSANVAEISTLIAALKRVKKCYNPENTFVEIHGDSKIALGRCHRALNPKKQYDPSFATAVTELNSLCMEFAKVETLWRGRAASVKLFGH